jgi:predicted N-acetyltransferase YhbS
MPEELARHPVPVMLLARLAVDHSRQRQGMGKAPLKDAMLRARCGRPI